MTDDPATAGGDGAFRATGEVNDPKVLSADETDEVPLGRKAGVGLPGFTTRQATHSAGRRQGEVVQIQIATEWKQQPLAIGGEGILDNAAQGGRSRPFTTRLFLNRERRFLGQQRPGIHQTRLLAGLQVISPKIQPVFVLDRALQPGNAGAVWGKAQRTQTGSGQLRRRKQALQRQGIGTANHRTRQRARNAARGAGCTGRQDCAEQSQRHDERPDQRPDQRLGQRDATGKRRAQTA